MLVKLDKFKKAMDSFKKVLKYEPNNKSVQKQMKSIKIELYDDRDDVVMNEDEKDAILQLQRLKKCTSKDHHLLDGVFKMLMKPDEFQKVIYPGIEKEKLKNAPASLKELCSSSYYSQPLMDMMPRVERKAASVLENVKARGAQLGDYMDLQTENLLKPQIFQEAFARELIQVVNKVHSMAHVQYAMSKDSIAKPDDQMNSIPAENLLELASTNTGYTVIPEPWIESEIFQLVLDDLERLKQSDRLQDVKSTLLGSEHTKDLGKLSYLESTDCEDEYPAIAEVIKRLHAIPHELNHKLNLQLHIAAIHTTLLTQYTQQQCQPLHTDSGQGTLDTGYAYTCIYMINECQAETSIQLKNSSIDYTIPVKSNSLVLFNSRLLMNAKSPILTKSSSDTVHYLTFWIHGRDISSDLD